MSDKLNKHKKLIILDQLLAEHAGSLFSEAQHRDRFNRRLGIGNEVSRPTMGRYLKDLEKELGVTIYKRPAGENEAAPRQYGYGYPEGHSATWKSVPDETESYLMNEALSLLGSIEGVSQNNRFVKLKQKYRHLMILSDFLRKKSDKIIIFALTNKVTHDCIKKNKTEYIGFSG